MTHDTRPCLDWFEQGTSVADVFLRSGDAEFILDSDFSDDEGIDASDLEWRECSIPIEMFNMAPSLDAHLKHLVGSDPRQLTEEYNRCQSIESWIDEAGGIEKALNQSPILVTMKSGKVKIEDGYHRLGIAFFNHEATSIRALCAQIKKQPEEAPEVFSQTVRLKGP